MNNFIGYKLKPYTDFDRVLYDCGTCELDYIKCRLDTNILDSEGEEKDISEIILDVTKEVCSMIYTDTYYLDQMHKTDELIYILKPKFSRNIIELIIKYNTFIPAHHLDAKCRVIKV